MHPKTESGAICMDMCTPEDCGLGSKTLFSAWQKAGMEAIIMHRSKPFTGIHPNSPTFEAVTLGKSNQRDHRYSFLLCLHIRTYFTKRSLTALIENQGPAGKTNADTAHYLAQINKT